MADEKLSSEIRISVGHVSALARVFYFATTFGLAVVAARAFGVSHFRYLGTRVNQRDVPILQKQQHLRRELCRSVSREQLAYIGRNFEMRGSPVVSMEGPEDWPRAFGNGPLLSQLSRDPVDRLLESSQGTVGIKVANFIDLLAGNLPILHYCGSYDVSLKVALLVQAIQQLRQPGTRPAWKM